MDLETDDLMHSTHTQTPTNAHLVSSVTVERNGLFVREHGEKWIEQQGYDNSLHAWCTEKQAEHPSCTVTMPKIPMNHVYWKNDHVFYLSLTIRLPPC